MVISENDGIVRLGSSNGRYIVYLDPLDGSSNIDVNVSVGSMALFICAKRVLILQLMKMMRYNQVLMLQPDMCYMVRVQY